MIEEIECLRLKLQHLAFTDLKTASETQIDSLQPRTVESIQPNSRRGSGAIYTSGSGRIREWVGCSSHGCIWPFDIQWDVCDGSQPVSRTTRGPER